MEEHTDGKKSRWDRLKQHYHLILRNQDTFEELYNLRLNLLNVYIILCTVLFLVALVVFLLIAYTPLRNYVPGYGTLESNKAYITMLNRVKSLESQIEAQDVYIESFRKMITQDVEYGEGRAIDSLAALSDAKVLERIPEDEQLRRSVELEDRITVTQTNLQDGPESSPSFEQIIFVPPVEGIVMMDFDLGKKHYGIDVAAPEKSPVKAVLEGRVISSGWNMETGHTMAIQHRSNIVSFYKHNASLLKKTGDYVTPGEVVAIAGNTGKHTDGPHLHFELWIDGNPVDPARYIRFAGKR